MCFETVKLQEKTPVAVPKFKIGDKVKVTRAAKSRERGWINSWIKEMNLAVGQIGTVVSLHSDEARLDVPGIKEKYFYPLFVLEPVTEKPTEKTFKVGDRVQVKYGYGWDGLGTVKADRGGFFDVKLDHKTYEGSFYPNQLTFIEAKPYADVATPKTEVAAAQQGISAAVKSHNRVFTVAQAFAVALAKSNAIGVTNADAVQAKLAEQGFTSADLGNAAGALFRGKNWKKYNTQKSARKGNHAREISNWMYVGA
jgi:hypothetical protein